MTDTLKQRITDDVKTAMRAKEKARLGTLRLITSAIKQIEVDERIEPDDNRILVVLEKMVKQRRDSISQFSDAGRQELVEIEEQELVIIQEYMPAPLSEDELSALIDEAISASGAASMQEMGKVMGILKSKVQGRADMGAVSASIKAKLSAA